MKPYAFPTGKDPAFLFGCGRFRMEEHLLENCAEEILRFGRRPLFVCDDNSHAVAFEKVAASLRAAGVEPKVLRHHGFCNREDALDCAECGALGVTNLVVEFEAGVDFNATPGPGAYFVEGSCEFSVAPGADAPTRYKLQDWNEARGEWDNQRTVNGTAFTYETASATAAKMKITWCKTKAFMLIVR